MHFGVKGMKWGHRKDRYYELKGRKKKAIPPNVVHPDNMKPGSKKTYDKNVKAIEKEKHKQAKREARSKKYLEKVDKLEQSKQDVLKNGMKSKAFLNAYGVAGAKASNAEFALMFGVSKDKAVQGLVNKFDKKIKRNKEAAEATLNGKLTHDQKIAIGCAVAVGVYASMGAYGVYKRRKEAADFKKRVQAGKKISESDFMKQYSNSVYRNLDNDFAGVLDDNDVIIPKGTTFKRMSANPETTLRKNIYATFTEDDANRYKAILPRHFNWISEEKSYQIEMEAMGEVRAPSLKKRVEVFKELLATDDSFKSFYGDEVCSRAYERGHEEYAKFAQLSAGRNKIGNIYFNKLKEMGYNAWVDDNDRGMLSDTPLVLFNDDGFIKRVKANELSKDDIREALDNLKEISNRRL